MTNLLSPADLQARIAERNRTLQNLRIESAYPELGDLDRESLDLARGVLVRLNRRDEKRLENLKEVLA